MDYLTVCAIYRDEADFLEEWLEFHRLVGVQRFFLYDNLSTDSHREVLAPYITEGAVLLKDWPQQPGQIPAYLDCLQEHRGNARWIAFLDIDEFLFSPTFAPLAEVLEPYERWPGVHVNWATFGPSGHETKPDGLVTESYTYRAPDNHPFNRMCKCVVDPARTSGIGSVHAFNYGEEWAVDENFQPLATRPRGQTQKSSWKRLRINHYFIKSKEQWMAKIARPKGDDGVVRKNGYDSARYAEHAEMFSRVFDDTIQSYLPALKAALTSETAVRPASQST